MFRRGEFIDILVSSEILNGVGVMLGVASSIWIGLGGFAKGVSGGGCVCGRFQESESLLKMYHKHILIIINHLMIDKLTIIPSYFYSNIDIFKKKKT